MTARTCQPPEAATRAVTAWPRAVLTRAVLTRAVLTRAVLTRAAPVGAARVRTARVSTARVSTARVSTARGHAVTARVAASGGWQVRAVISIPGASVQLNSVAAVSRSD